MTQATDAPDGRTHDTSAGTGSPDAATRARDRARLLERVRKLFAMAQETEASPHEAEIALRRCQSLMARYGISESDLETSEFGSRSVTTRRTVPMHLKIVGAAVGELHDVIFVIGGGGRAEFRGYAIDTDVAALTFDYLLAAIERALSARRRRGDFPPGRSAAYDYRVGFAREVSLRVRRLVADRRAAERDASGAGTALTVRKREIVDRECGSGLAHRSVRARGPRDVRAAAAGRDDGAQVSLDPQVSAGTRAEALIDD